MDSPGIPPETSNSYCLPGRAGRTPIVLAGFNATMSALTPTRGCACGLLNLAHIPCSLPRRSLHVTCRTFRALRLQPPLRLPRSLCHLSCQRRGLPAHHGSALRHSIPRDKPVGRLLARQTARPNRVRVPTDCPFAFRCSPPHLAATQLRSATGRKQVSLKGACTSLMWHACGRTMAGTGPAMTRGKRCRPNRPTTLSAERLLCGATPCRPHRLGRRYPPSIFGMKNTSAPGFTGWK